MTNLHQVVLQGREASTVLENEAYKRAMEQLRSQVIEAWKAAPVRDTEGQKLLLQLIKLCDKFEGLLGGMIENGKFAQHKIDLDNLRDENLIKRTLRKIA